MNVTRLKLANVRSVEAAELVFQPGFNLIVGVNGAGKTTALNALAVCLSAITKHANQWKGPGHGFSTEEIRIGTNALTVECSVSLAGKVSTYLVHLPRDKSVPRKNKTGSPREQTFDTPTKSEFLGYAPKIVHYGDRAYRPMAVLFSTRRALPSDRAPSKGSAAGNQSAAFAEAFSARELRLGEFAAWMNVQKAMTKEKAGGGKVLTAFKHAVERFLPNYTNLRSDEDDPSKLVIDRNGLTIPVKQLSDGERGCLALVLDLTRRLAQANPNLADPAKEASCVVLIDEIDLHLHPKWQRQIVKNLPDAFPKAQFIATTHSPQVIGEVPHDRIQIMGHEKVFSPTHSFGVDSSRVLEEIMEAPPRTAEIQNLLSGLSKQITAKNLAAVRKTIQKLAAQIGDNDAEVIRAKTMLDFLEDAE